MTSTDAGAEEITENQSAGYVRSFMVLLFAVNLLNYIDRLAITGLLEPIRKTLARPTRRWGWSVSRSR